MKKNILFLLIFLCIFSTFNLVAERSFGKDDGGRPPAIILVFMNQLDLDRLIDIKTENIDLLQKNGAFGVVNVRQADGYHPESIYLSLNTGNRCNRSKFVQKGIMDKTGPINPFIDYIIKDNLLNNYKPDIGFLGERLVENGLKAAVIGNSDTIAKGDRSILAAVIDKSGRTSYGAIDNSILKKVDYSWGYETDWDEMKENFDIFKDKADLIMVETGDLTRTDSLNLSPIIKDSRRESVKKIDDFIGYIIQNIDLEQTSLGVLSLVPSLPALKKGDTLGWALFSGGGYSSGWLISKSTKRKGLITISDLTAAILEEYNITGTNIPGRPISLLSDDRNWSDLFEFEDSILSISAIRPLFIKGFIFFQIILIFIGVLRRYSRGIKGIFFEYILLMLLLSPINFLLISLYISYNPYHYFLLYLLFSIVEIYFLLTLLDKREKRVFAIITLLFFMISFDLLGNYKLMADSILGYSSVIGARYYGLGNEYLGIYLGIFLLEITVFLPAFFKMGGKKELIYNNLFFLVFFILVGSPGLGANFGGTLTAVVSFVVIVYFNYMKDPKMRLYILLFILISAGIVIFSNYSLEGDSHIGRAINLFKDGEFNILKQIIIRKAKINIKLFKWTIWSKVFIVLFVYLSFFTVNPPSLLKKIYREYPLMKIGFYSVLSSCFAAFFFNDSGVVASATLLFYPVMVVLYLNQGYN